MTQDNTSRRKQDHIELAFDSQVWESDSRFYYEPMLAAHPGEFPECDFEIAGRKMRAPLWVSSMTGGAEKAGRINHNLARACAEFGLGMGLGSCRILLDSDEYLPDFAVRKLIGDQPLFANLGIAQIEQLLENNSISKATELVRKLEADGMMVHINPLQEWLQPEGDRVNAVPMETLKRFLDKFHLPVIVKEVGQGFGPRSLQALMELPIEAIEFGAHGGTNFSRLELLRSGEKERDFLAPVAAMGHSAEEMTGFVNHILQDNHPSILCKKFIISGGIRDFLEGFYLTEKIKGDAIYAQASSFLKHSLGEYEELQSFTRLQVKGLALAQAYLKIRNTPHT